MAWRRLLVIDDHYAAEASESRRFFDRHIFERQYGSLGHDLAYCTAWDESASDYSVEVAVHAAASGKPDLILLDVRFGSHDLLGLEILTALGENHPGIPVVIMTSTPREGTVIGEAIACGAVDYLVKPIPRELIGSTIDRYLEPSPRYWLIGQTESFLRALDQVSRGAEGGQSTMLLLGAPGTGKELFARYAHRHGRRRDAPLQTVHIPAIPEHLLEAELFGYRKGAFTGAIRDEPGRLCRADGGVLFLDEVGDLSPAAQAALLRVLESGEVARLGDGHVTRIDVQVIAATNADLALMVKTNQFRLDLYSRLSGTVVQLPPLSDRAGDLSLLLRQLVRRVCVERGLSKRFFDLPAGANDLIEEHSWPGNIRDLWHVVQRVADIARDGEFTLEHFQEALSGHALVSGATAAPVTQAATGLTAVTRLPDSVVRDAQRFVDELAMRELSLLFSALELTRDPVGGAPNRAKAAALLKKKPRCSTNEFDRWVTRVLDRMSEKQRRWAEEHYPELIGVKAVGATC